jgi:hypothetical protein
MLHVIEVGAQVNVDDSRLALLAAAGEGAILAVQRRPHRQCSVAVTGDQLGGRERKPGNWLQQELTLTDRQKQRRNWLRKE